MGKFTGCLLRRFFLCIRLHVKVGKNACLEMSGCPTFTCRFGVTSFARPRLYKGERFAVPSHSGNRSEKLVYSWICMARLGLPELVSIEC